MSTLHKAPALTIGKKAKAADFHGVAAGELRAETGLATSGAGPDKSGKAAGSRAMRRLRDAGLRTTRQRLALAEILFGDGLDRHVTAESLFARAAGMGARLSLATVYNCLHQFTNAGLLRIVTVDSGRAYFDTNLSQHHHFYYERSGELSDIPACDVQLAQLPAAPAGQRISRVDVILRLDAAKPGNGPDAAD